MAELTNGLTSKRMPTNEQGKERMSEQRKERTNNWSKKGTNEAPLWELCTVLNLDLERTIE